VYPAPPRLNLLLRRSLKMGVLCLPIGGAVGAWIAGTALGEGYDLFLLYAPLAAFLAGTLLWLGIAARRPGRVKGALAGFLAGCFGHWICWYLVIAHNRIGHLLTGGFLSSLGEPPMDLFTALWGAAIYSFWSLIVMGWATMSIGAGIGYFLGRRQEAE
jgi:hypothetical protein